MTIKYTNQFRKDYKRMQRQKKDLQKLRHVINALTASRTLETRYRDHPLSGNWKGYGDCHLEPDWVLIYKVNEDILTLARMGSHSEVFKK
ncbi:MAG: type II toxin-antitoxin system YafQ family toxin [Candidatus Latescibacteria bacterium]|nr:type II toxin-antitoxin system YafQ family toxin [Candidatus Latescibacterota bacterium]